MVTLSVVAGLVLALAAMLFVRKLPPATARRVFAIGLVVTALIYVALAIAGRAGPRWIGLELLGVAVYGAFAWVGLRHWASMLALGWAAHVGWDLAFHLRGAGAAFTPAWYPWFCLGFDLPIAVAILAHGGRKGWAVGDGKEYSVD